LSLCLVRMAYDYKEYLDLARSLATSNTQKVELAKRTVASRAYYSTLHGAIDFITVADGEQISQLLSSHDAVWVHFKRRGPTRNAVWLKAKMLKMWREWADYDDPKKPPPASAADVLTVVGELQALLEQLCNSQTPVPHCWFPTA
jgi:hypothetical protein